MKSFLITFFIISALLSVSCSNKKNPHIKSIDGITHVYNTNIASSGIITPELELVKEIDSQAVTTESEAFFDDVAQDSRNNFFILDGKASKIYKFNPEGNFEKTFLQKGEGPAEIRKPVLTFKVSGNNVWASSVTEFCRFDTNGNFLEKKCFKRQYGLLEHVDEKRFITCYDSYNEGKKTGSVCVLMDTQENLLTELYKNKKPDIGYSILNVQGTKFVFVSSTSPRIGYSYNSLNNLIYCYYNFDYSIMVIGLDGKMQKVIHKEHQPMKLKEQEIERLAKGFKQMGWPPYYVDAYKRTPPEKYLPVIRKIYLLPNNYLGVVRCIDLDTDELDIFDSEGRFTYILKTSKNIPDLTGVYFFKNSIGVIIHEDEREVFIEYKIKNLPKIY